jgi:hypothetical protein
MINSAYSGENKDTAKINSILTHVHILLSTLYKYKITLERRYKNMSLENHASSKNGELPTSSLLELESWVR